MNVAILVQNLRVGGIQRIAIDQANELARRGHTVSVITFEPERKGDSMRALLQIPAENVISITYARLRSIAGMQTLVRTLKSSRPDLLLTHHWFANTVGRTALFFMNVKTVLSFEHSTEDARRPKQQFLIDQLLQDKSAVIIAVSNAVRDSLILHGIREEKVRVIPNGAVFTPTPAKTAGPGNQFIFIGRLVHDKGVDLLLSALAQVTDATLTILGDGPERSNLELKAQELGISSRVRFDGFSANPAGALKDADCLIMPSRREGFGIAALEALAQGLPVIVSDVVAAHGFVKDGVNRLVVRTNDLDSLARQMRLFTQDPALRDRLSAAAPQGLEPYSIKAHVDAVLSFVPV